MIDNQLSNNLHNVDSFWSQKDTTNLCFFPKAVRHLQTDQAYDTIRKVNYIIPYGFTEPFLM